MTVRLSVSVRPVEDVESRIPSTGLGLKASTSQAVKLGARGPTSLEARVRPSPRLDVGSGAVQVLPSGETFQGPYELTPTLDGFGVETARLYMADDMTVKPIPISDVSNPYDGRTVTIG